MLSIKKTLALSAIFCILKIQSNETMMWLTNPLVSVFAACEQAPKVPK